MPLYLETLIYKFYKNWEEHQKRHYRGREAEEYVIRILRQNGYNAGKIRVICKSKEMEIDCAIPPNNNFKVVIMIREGVFRDLVNYPALTDRASPPHDGDFLLLRATSIPFTHSGGSIERNRSVMPRVEEGLRRVALHRRKFPQSQGYGPALTAEA
ncbi:hypothetical protein [Saccharolobus islandicus]|uniref:hypothetical protein n=1 Tax=Saccharolobus islandicus TaxID=43080 RepID=UPI00234B15B8|nr:hypothetical protein [Sulfolobus islandicus]